MRAPMGPGPVGQGPGPGPWAQWARAQWALGPGPLGPVGPWAHWALGPMGPYGTFQIHLSSQNVYVNDLGMSGPIFRVPDQN